MIGIFDIDSIVYEACYSTNDLEEAIESFWGRFNDAAFHIEKRYGTATIIPIGFCTNNYRKTLDPSYKANRTSPKPEFFNDLVTHIKEELQPISRKGIETDDLVAKYLKYYGKDDCVIISIDKDYLQFECTIFNYRKREFITVSKDEAIFNFMEQMVIGDTADNVNFCKGFGKAWVKKNLVGKNEYGQRRAVYSLFKRLYRSKGKEMYTKCYMLLKLDLF